MLSAGQMEIALCSEQIAILQMLHKSGRSMVPIYESDGQTVVCEYIIGVGWCRLKYTEGLRALGLVEGETITPIGREVLAKYNS